MKKPRVSDFDPTAVVPLRSPMDDLPAIEVPPTPPATPPVNSSFPISPVQTSEERNERMLKRTNQRSKIRHTFDILSDQLLALREIAVERERVFGNRTLLGDLVQEALDMFIAKERNNQ